MTLDGIILSMQEYVLGFLFSPGLENVVLIEKRRPVFMRGRYNGLGGKIKPGEVPANAIRREFLEEAGVDVMHWACFAILEGVDYRVYVFSSADEQWQNCRTTEDEDVVFVKVSELYKLSQKNKLMEHVHWLIHMARENRVTVAKILI